MSEENQSYEESQVMSSNFSQQEYSSSQQNENQATTDFPITYSSEYGSDYAPFPPLYGGSPSTQATPQTPLPEETNDIDNIFSGKQQLDLNSKSTQEDQSMASPTEQKATKPKLKSPLFKQHQRLQTLAILPNDRFVKGSNGKGVFAVQIALKKLYPKQAVGKYGVYGEEMITLVEKFQKQEGLGVDGEFGQNTLLSLDQYSFPKTVVSKEGTSVERVDGFDVKKEINRPAKIAATSKDIAIAKGEDTIHHKDQSEDEGIHHNKKISGVRVYSDPTKNSKLKITVKYNTDVTLVGVYSHESSWSLIRTVDGTEGWINSDYITEGNSDIGAALSESDLTMIEEEHENLGDLVKDRYGSSFIKEQDARLIIQSIALMNEGRSAIYYKGENGEKEHTLSWWEKLLLNETEEGAREIYQNINIRSGMNILLPSEALIVRMKDEGQVSSGSINDKVKGAIDFLKMSGGFTVGILEGLWEGLKGTLQAVPDLLKMVWDIIKSAIQGQLFVKLEEILSSIWGFITNLPQAAEQSWQEFKKKSPYEKGTTVGKGVGMIAFEVILALLSGGAVNAIKAAGIVGKLSKVAKISDKITGFQNSLGSISKKMLNEIDDIIKPMVVITPDGRTFTVKRKDLPNTDKPHINKMEGDGEGGFKKNKADDETKKTEKQKQKQNKADDAIDEHDLGEMKKEERDALFKRDADRGIYRGQRIRSKDKKFDLELDRVDIKNKVIIEDKKAKGFDKNPLGTDIAIQKWTQSNIYKNAEKKINFITEKADHIYHSKADAASSPHRLDISEIKNIKTIKYKIKSSKDAYDGELNKEIKKQIGELNKTFPSWKIEIEYNK